MPLTSVSTSVKLAQRSHGRGHTRRDHWTQVSFRKPAPAAATLREAATDQA